MTSRVMHLGDQGTRLVTAVAMAPLNAHSLISVLRVKFRSGGLQTVWLKVINRAQEEALVVVLVK